MCSLISWGSAGFVADIKKKYVLNIVKCADACENIDRIVLFGSATESRCTDASDIDIAVFGKKPQNAYLRSEEFKQFQRRLFSFENKFDQDYDILYFSPTDRMNTEIMKNIDRGTEIYRRAEQ